MSMRSEFEVIPQTAKYIAGIMAVGMALVFILLISLGKVGVPEGLTLMCAGALGGAFVGALVLLAGYVYGDAQRRGMPAGWWTLLVLLVPNFIGFLLYFLLRKPLLAVCANCNSGVEPGSAFCPRCGAAQGAIAR